MTSTVTVADVAAYLASQATDPEIDRFFELSHQRTKFLNSARAAMLTTGDAVRIQGMSPKYLNGLQGKVGPINTSRKGPYTTLLLDKASTAKLRKASKSYYIPADAEDFGLEGIPLSCCVPQE
ncbi:hypothetical protein ACFY4B_27310 [Kitasatospora sp. NPDC001261]|uniref:hypothetical protein n=1 Tax=Kitasatospora sp. NPDC001261 TaxID=3364012 RepID=UPI0036C06600